MLQREPPTLSIGVISYYAQQVHEIRLRCDSDRVTVDTVDSFQGALLDAFSLAID